MNTIAAPTKKKKVQHDINKVGLYRFPYLQQENLDMGNVSDYPTVFGSADARVPYKLWKNIDGVPFLINGYLDEAYSCVTRVLAAQAGKLLNMPCEEAFFANIDGKHVTATAFVPAISILENLTFSKYPLSSAFDYQSNQKHAFYFLIQHWTAYAVVKSKLKERFDRHYVDEEGNVFLAGHEQAAFLTPQLMPRSLIVPLTVVDVNYRAIKDMMVRVGDRDIAEIVFGSIPEEMIEAHDEVAKEKNKHTFQQRKEAFDGNWTKLVKGLDLFENNSQSQPT